MMLADRSLTTPDLDGISPPPVGDSQWTCEDAEEHVRDEHSTYSWLSEPMTEAAGLEIREAVYGDDRFLAEYLVRAS